MSNLEMVSFREYPNDPYTKAICTIRIDKKHVVAYAKKVTKTGSEFWAAPSISVTDGAEKSFIPGYMVDSRSEENLILDFVKECAKRFKPTSMSEVAANDGLPF